MSPRVAVKRRRRRQRVSGQAAGSNRGAGALLSQVTALVAENQALARQNRELRASLETINRAVQAISSGTTHRRRGRTAQAASTRPVGRPGRRRRSMSQETLAKRRAGLAKARAVLARKRAAAKQRGRRGS